MRKSDAVGIDVGAQTLVVALERDGRRKPPRRFANTPSGHQRLIRQLTTGGRRVRVVLEATGIYSLDVALALHRTAGIEVMVANPRATEAFATATLRRSKTDPIDAAGLLEFCKRMPFMPWSAPAPEALELRALSRRIAALTKMRGQEKNRLHAARHTLELAPLVRRDLEVNIRHLERRITRLQAQARAHIERHSALRQAYAHLCSVRGIAEVSGVQLLGELAMLDRAMTVRQWVATAGLDPRQVQSGSSIHKPARISKAGNKHLRRALYMPALVAARREPHVAAFYQRLLARGKRPMQANVAVMRKLLHAIYGMLKHDADFRGEKLYAMAH